MGRDNKIQGSERTVVRGPITYKIWQEYDDTGTGPDYLGEAPNRSPETPFYDVRAGVLVTMVDQSFDDPHCTAYQLAGTGPDSQVVPADYVMSDSYPTYHSAKYIHKFQHSLDGELSAAERLEHIRYCILDAQRLVAFFNDEWHMTGVCVQAFVDGTPITEKYEHALWGIESDSEAYFDEVANDLIADIESDLDEIASVMRADENRFRKVAELVDDYRVTLNKA